MKKLKVVAAASMITFGLINSAQATLTKYEITGTVLSTSAQTNGDSKFSATIYADPTLSDNKVSSIALNYGNLTNFKFSFDSDQLNNFELKFFSYTTNPESFNINYQDYPTTADPTAKNQWINFTKSEDNTGQSIYGSFSWEAGSTTAMASVTNIKATPTPIPAAAWLLGSGLLGMVGLKRRKTTAA